MSYPVSERGEDSPAKVLTAGKEPLIEKEEDQGSTALLRRNLHPEELKPHRRVSRKSFSNCPNNIRFQQRQKKKKGKINIFNQVMKIRIHFLFWKYCPPNSALETPVLKKKDGTTR